MYAEDGSLLGEYPMEANPATVPTKGAQHIWLPTGNGPMPIAVVGEGRQYAVHADHLNTPRRLTQEDGKVAWQWAYSAFGDEAPTTAATRFTSATTNPTTGSTAVPLVQYNLRYPGQYFDEESGLHYNHFRSYDSKVGRYTQADPIGLEGGWNRFAYVGGNPLLYTDRLGLATEEEIRKAVATLRCANPDEFKRIAKSVSMANMGEDGPGVTNWSNNITLNSRLYGDSNTPVDEFVHDRFLQTLAHEMLHVNQGIGGKVMSRIRMGHPLGVLHRQLDGKAEGMITHKLLDQYKKALQNGDSGCSCTS